MLLLKFLLVMVSVVSFLGGTVVLLADLARQARRRWRLSRGEADAGPPVPIRWRRSLRLAALAVVPFLIAASLFVVPSGRGGVRVSQISGTLPGTLYPGVHLINPLLDQVILYDTREHVLARIGDPKDKAEALLAQSKEGLTVGLAVSVRYCLDPRRLDYVHANLPASPEQELVPPVVASVFRQIVPNYMVREVFASKREEIRLKAAEAITRKLAADAIQVREVMLRDVILPAEYAKGLEGLLLKEQENERMVYDIQIKEKEVRTAELEAEAQKAREVKRAEAQARVRVLQAQAEADAMQYTLPLKQKQIEQSRLEAEARKEATLMNAEAAAQAKVIDSKADVERSNLLAGAEAHRIRITSSAESERLKLESDVLRENPLLIQKIVAERLSDKMQIMMVPMDGRNFFANEVFRQAAAPLMDPPAPAEPGKKAVARK